MWTFIQDSGQLFKDNILVDTGYSGHGEGLNNPAFEQVHDKGPIPVGDWLFEGPPYNDPAHGPYVLRIIPGPNTITYGRTGFLCHGDEKEHPGEYQASLGCMVAPRATRSRIWQSGDPKLEVIRTRATAQTQGE